MNWSDHRSETNTRFHSHLGWESIPARDHFKKPEKGARWGRITSNSLGFRSAEVDPSRRLVVVMGDSVVWGWGQGDDKIMPHFLETLVRPVGLQVVNMGVAGYGLDQHAMNLERHLSSLKNIAVVVMVISTSNDLTDTVSNARYGAKKPLFRWESAQDNGPRLTGVPIPRYCLRNVFFKSHILGTIRSAGWARGLNMLLDRVAGDRVLDRPEGERVTRSMIERVRALAGSRKATTLFVLYPNRADLQKPTADHLWFKKTLAASGAAVIDYREALVGYDLPQPVERLYGDDGHLNTVGNQIFASAIAQKLRSMSIVPYEPR